MKEEEEEKGRKEEEKEREDKEEKREKLRTLDTSIEILRTYSLPLALNLLLFTK